MRAREAIALLAVIACGCNEAFADRVRTRVERGGPTGGVAPDITNPTDGTAIVFTQSASGELTLNWGDGSDSVGVDHYEVRASNAGSQTSPADCTSGNTVTGCADPTASNCTATGLTNFSDYAFRVCATDAAGNMSSGLTGFQRPWVDALSVYLNNGSTNEYATIADNAALECGANDQITAWCWHKTLDISTTDRMMIVKGTTSGGTVDSWSLVTIANTAADTYSVRFAVSAIGDYCMFGAGTDDDAGSGWYFAAATCNLTLTGGGTATETNDIKCDAVRTAEGTEPSAFEACTGGAPTVMPDELTDDNTPLSIGGLATTPSFPWIGYLDECGYACIGKVDISVIACLARNGHPNDPRNCFTAGTPIHYYPIGDGDTHPTITDRSSNVTAMSPALSNSEVGDFDAEDPQ